MNQALTCTTSNSKYTLKLINLLWHIIFSSHLYLISFNVLLQPLMCFLTLDWSSLKNTSALSHVHLCVKRHTTWHIISSHAIIMILYICGLSFVPRNIGLINFFQCYRNKISVIYTIMSWKHTSLIKILWYLYLKYYVFKLNI